MFVTIIYLTISLCTLARLGILIVRHLKRLERVIVGYLEVYDGPEEVARLYTLQALENTIQHAWPRYRTTMCDCKYWEIYYCTACVILRKNIEFSRDVY